MIARLWWKEMRVVWPAWAVLIWVAIAVQLMVINLSGPNRPNADVVVITVAWSVLYALVAGAAAFAGERENETLGLLDALAVRRPTLWAGKVSFVLATTVGLAAVLLVLGVLGVDWHWGSMRQPELLPNTRLRPGETLPLLSWTDVVLNVSNQVFKALPVLATVLFMAAAWGLFWSAAIRNPMVAGVAALGTVGGMLWLGNAGDRPAFFSNTFAYPLCWGTALLALGGSAWLMIRPPQAAWVRNWGARAEDADGEIFNPARSRAIAVRPASANRSLRWKAFRQGWIWAALSLAWAWGGLLSLFLIDYRGTDSGSTFAFFLCVELGLVLIAGVGVFGDETVRGTQRFLLHQGVRPGRIWIRAAGVWLLVFALIAAGAVLIPAALPLLNAWWSGRFGRTFVELLQLPPHVSRDLAGAVVATLTVFTVGLLAGMVFRRRITATLVAVLAFLGVVALPLTLVMSGYLPERGMLLIPLSLALISWAWSGDWLDERPGAGRWLRLAGLVAVPLVTLPLAYVAYRAWGVADVGPIAQNTPPPPAPESGNDTARAFDRLAREFEDSVFPLSRGKSVDLKPGYSLPMPAPMVERIRRAAAELPPIWPAQARPGGTAFTGETEFRGMMLIVSVLDDHAGALIEKGDLDGAWADIRALRQIARKYVGDVATTFTHQYAVSADRLATLRGLRWAAHPAQDESRLRAAIRELLDLAPLPTPADVLRAEAPILDRTLDLPVEELERGIMGTGYRETMRRVFDTLVVFPWWERERARRVIREDIASLLAANAPVEFRRRVFPVLDQARRGIQPNIIVASLLPSPWMVDEYDRAAAGGAALVQVLALRAWGLAHGGAYPNTLETLVADGLLAQLPADPYSGRPFTWVPTGGRYVLPVTLRNPRAADKPGTIPAGRWQLIAAGPDGTYSGDGNQGFGTWFGPPNDDLIFPQPNDDLIFPLP